MGPIMMDVAGTSLTAEDKELLAHPWVGGLILFTRNFQDSEQLSALTHEIKAAAKNDLIIAVDHEGGRVQRFREGFSLIPAMGSIWSTANESLEQAQNLAFYAGQLMAMEVHAVGIDISFAPVLDINGISDVIGDRAFHQSPDIVSELASAFIKGMNHVGMKCTAKHFPGHGSVKEDSHIALPVDNRSKEDILGIDIEPFRQLMTMNMVDAVMPAHVIYPALDSHSVGFSPFWLQQVLRNQLGFDGVIFSDDLSMEGASSIGGYVERSEAAQQAGCDMLLLCNNRDSVIEVIDNTNLVIDARSSERLTRMLAKPSFNFKQLPQMAEWQKARQVLGIT